LESKYSVEEINGMFAPFQVERISSTETERDEAKRIAVKKKIPRGDALHAIMARDNNLILITRDKHFRQLETISVHYKPEDII
jgi:predicted nucleic acid-binding protein